MAAQPHIPYAILPKRFEPKQVPTNGLQQQSRSSNFNNYNNLNGGRRRRPAAPRRSQRQQDYYDDQWIDEDDDVWLEPRQSTIRRRFNQRSNRSYGQSSGYYGPRQRLDNYYDSYSYGPFTRKGQIPFRSRRRVLYQDDGYTPLNIVPSYDLNEWQGPYARSKQSLYSQQQRGGFRYGRQDNGYIRDDHRINASSRQSRSGYKPLTPTRSGKQTKSPRTKGGQQKRRNSRQRKPRSQTSKTEGTPSTNTNELKSSKEDELTDEFKQKLTTSELEEKPLPPRDD